MKKLFTILMICFAVVAVQAQNAKIVLEVTDANMDGIVGGGVWGDGTGYQILIDADAEAMDDDPAYYECGQSYGDFEFMIPANAQAADEFVVVSGRDSVEIPAGTYDIIIANPGCAGYQKVWFASDDCDDGQYNDYAIEANKCYTFTLSMSPEYHDCTTLTIEEMSGVGIAEETMNTCNIYPNPASSVLNIEAEGYDSYQITNLLGQVVMADAISGHAQVNIQNLNDGVYFVRLSNENGVYTQKFIKK